MPPTPSILPELLPVILGSLVFLAVCAQIAHSIIQGRSEERRHRWEVDERERAAALAALALETARKLAELTAEKLAEQAMIAAAAVGKADRERRTFARNLAKNTAMTQQAVAGAKLAYAEANAVNRKIEAAIVAGRTEELPTPPVSETEDRPH